jgi:putative iron-regulated protein
MAQRTLIGIALLGAALSVALGVVACGSEDGPSDDAKREVIEHYADGVHASYAASLASATAMDQAIDAFLANPSDETLAAARQAWLDARDDYGPTEAFRFYDGPIDNAETGPEGLMNAWPMDEAYVDYVEGSPNAGIINDVDTYPEITADLLVSLNEEGGETNIATGWHAIEFLLWGQDLNADGPGDRPVSDYTTADNAGRRGEYLATASDLLVEHLGSLVAAWDPDAGNNYYDEFIALDSDDALIKIITGIGELSRGELAGERMTVAYEARSQEDEHSCFSDNTTADIVANATGIQRVYLGDYPGIDDGPGIYNLVRDTDEELADRLRDEIETSVSLARGIPAPFDQNLTADVPDSSAGRTAILDTIEALELQTDTIVAAAAAMDVTISVS